MAAPSVCQIFVTSSISLVAAHLEVTLGVRLPIDRILSDNKQDSERDIPLNGRRFLSLQELDVLLEIFFASSSHSEEKRNESECASSIQDLVEPLSHISSRTETKRFALPLERYIDALLELVRKFRTKLHIAFSIPDRSAELLQIVTQRIL
ncbi:unnamed protein product [Sphagnum troendelagicum]|uniref:Uncharacterized protein n=1 Tax=Sphagnum troendelagicum TaxID=128251 RepID=A0ABP0UBG5_9BRYO